MEETGFSNNRTPPVELVERARDLAFQAYWQPTKRHYRPHAWIPMERSPEASKALGLLIDEYGHDYPFWGKMYRRFQLDGFDYWHCGDWELINRRRHSAKDARKDEWFVMPDWVREKLEARRALGFGKATGPPLTDAEANPRPQALKPGP